MWHNYTGTDWRVDPNSTATFPYYYAVSWHVIPEPEPPPKWWRPFDVFRTPLEYFYSVVVAFRERTSVYRGNGILDRRRFKRKRFVQALRRAVIA